MHSITGMESRSEHLSENQMTRIRRGNMGFIFQNYNLVDELNVVENVELPLVFLGLKRKERREQGLRNPGPVENGSPSCSLSSAIIRRTTTTDCFCQGHCNIIRPFFLPMNPPETWIRKMAYAAGSAGRTKPEGGTIVMVTHSPKGCQLCPSDHPSP